MVINPDMQIRADRPRRIMLLLTARTYRAEAFFKAAKELNVEVIRATDVPKQLSEYWNYPLGIEYNKPEVSVQAILEYNEHTPLGAILAVDDSGTIIAALASQALGLPHNSVSAAQAARDKSIMRKTLAGGNVQSPRAMRYTFPDQLDQRALEKIALELKYPSVIKPLVLNGSRGVIRVNDPSEFRIAAQQVHHLLKSIYPGGGDMPFLVEDYIQGTEVALEGIMDNGSLNILALFDKPDPLDGPFFEETIYVTPSRLDRMIQDQIRACATQAAHALGLTQGPVHAELRVNESGAWLIEMASRSIGGLCAKTLKFGVQESLESIIIRQAIGMPFKELVLSEEASGVMMIPIPEAGLLKSVHGCDEAASVPLIEEIHISAKINNLLTPLPEGDSYLGFIFARGDSPENVEAALRQAHAKLSFEIAPELPMASDSRWVQITR